MVKNSLDGILLGLEPRRYRGEELTTLFRSLISRNVGDAIFDHYTPPDEEDIKLGLVFRYGGRRVLAVDSLLIRISEETGLQFEPPLRVDDYISKKVGRSTFGTRVKVGHSYDPDKKSRLPIRIYGPREMLVMNTELPMVRLEDGNLITHLPEGHKTTFAVMDPETGEHYFEVVSDYLGPQSSNHHLYRLVKGGALEEMAVQAYNAQGVERDVKGPMIAVPLVSYSFKTPDGAAAMLTALFRDGVTCTDPKLKTEQGTGTLVPIRHVDDKAECDERCLTDLAAAELEPELTHLMKRTGFRKLGIDALGESDTFWLKEREIRTGRIVFTDPGDALNYEHKEEELLVNIAKYPRAENYMLSPCSRIFMVTYRCDLSGLVGLGPEPALRFIPPRESLSSLNSALQLLLGTRNVHICYSANMVRFAFDPMLYSKAASHDIPEGVKSGQLLFTVGMEYVLNDIGPLEEGAKEEAIRAITSSIAVATEFIKTYVRGQISTYNAQLDAAKNLISPEMAIRAAIIPASTRLR